MKAWIYSGGDECSIDDAVVFADEEPDGDYKRCPELDQYAEAGVPLEALLDRDWWLECSHCYHTILKSGCDADPEDQAECNGSDVEHVIVGDMAFCSDLCLEAWRKDREERKDMLDEAMDRAARLAVETFGLEPESVTATYERHGDHMWMGVARVRFPGSKSTARFYEDRRCYMQQQDLAAFEAWKAAGYSKPRT